MTLHINKADEAPPTVLEGWEALELPGQGPGKMLCRHHGHLPTLELMLVRGEIKVVCKDCVLDYCNIGWARETAPGEPDLSEPTRGEGPYE